MKKTTVYTTMIVAAGMILPISVSAAQITVAPGDTLYSLAKKHTTTVENIQQLNNLKTASIYVGQRLTISKSEPGTIVNAEWLNVRAGAGTQYYVKATIKGGTKIQVLSVSGTWSQIEVAGVTGYVETKYVQKASAVAQTTTEFITKTSGLFKSPGVGRVSSLAPQKVTVLERGTDGWMKVQTWLGPLWVKNGVTAEAAQIQYVQITKTSGLFQEPGITKVSTLAPQRVTVLATGTDGWLRVQTWKGPLWIKDGVVEELPRIEYFYTTKTSALFKTPGKDKVSMLSAQRVILVEKGSDGWMKVQTWLGDLWVKDGVVEEAAAPAPIPTPTAPSTEVIYVVVKGDSLSLIAQKYNTTVANIRTYNSLKTDMLQIGQKLKIPTSAPASLKIFNMPTDGVVQMTSGFGPRWGTQHYGTDFSRWGDVKILAAADGVVSKSELHASYGEVIYIKHTINGKNYETLYAHMRENTRAVKAGDRVQAGQFIGWMGTTGRSTGQHLHFEVHLEKYTYAQGSAVDPLLYLK